MQVAVTGSRGHAALHNDSSASRAQIMVRLSKSDISNKSSNKQESACFLLGLVFEPDEGGCTILRNAATLLLDYTKSHIKEPSMCNWTLVDVLADAAQ